MSRSNVLMRLSFRVPEEKRTAFARVYDAQIAPILSQCGFVPSDEPIRRMPGDVFARLFVLDSVGDFSKQRQVLAQDSAWRAALAELVSPFGNATPDGLFFYELALYRSPAGEGFFEQIEGQGAWRTYDATRGLATGFVFSMLEDRDGRLWFSAFGGGVSCFDGQTFRTYTRSDGLAHNEVMKIFQDRRGHFWFATDLGATQFDGQTFRTFTVADGLAHSEVTAIYEDRAGLLWFGTEGGLSRFDGQVFETLDTSDGLAHNAVSDIYEDANGHFWFATEGGLSRFNGSIFTTYTTREGLGANWVRRILCDRHGILWFATDGGGLNRYDGQTFRTFTVEDGLPHNIVLSLYEDHTGILWVGTINGVCTCDPGMAHPTFRAVSDVKNTRVWSILEDREGHLWFGTLSGVVRYDPRTFTSYTAARVEADYGVWAIFEDRDGRVWFSPFGGGVSSVDRDGIRTLTPENGLPEPIAISIGQDREGHQWFGTWDSGVCCYDGETVTCFTQEDGLAGNRVWCIVQDHRDGALWFGCWGGISRYDGTRFQTWTHRDGLPHERVRSLMQDRAGNLWIGSFAGACCYNGETFKTFTQADGLPDNSVWCIYEDRKGNFWFGTNCGVARYDGKHFQRFSKADGLAANNVNRVFEDRDGRLWFCTSGGGVSLFDGQVFQTLTEADGLGGNVVQSMAQDCDGHFWFGTGNGITRYRMPEPKSPGVMVDAVIADRRYDPDATIAVPDSIALIAFEFHGTSFKTRPEAMVYRCRLQGFDDWHTVRVPRVEYQDLPAGDYTFEVVAVDRDLVYSDAPGRVSFSVVRDIRDERIDELEARVRERTAQLVQVEKTAALGSLVAGLAHEINNPAGALTSAMDVLGRGIRRLNDLIGDDERQVQRILRVLKDSAQSAQLASGRIARVVKNLKTFARLDEAEYQKADLHDGLDSTVELLLNEMEGRISIVKQYGQVPAIYCYPAELNQLFMNVLTNAIQAIDGRGVIEIGTRTERSNVAIAISDTGRGMSPEVLTRIFEPGFKAGNVRVGTGLGLAISANIAEKHGGQIDAESVWGEGSTFTVRIPIRR